MSNSPRRRESSRVASLSLGVLMALVVTTGCSSPGAGDETAAPQEVTTIEFGASTGLETPLQQLDQLGINAGIYRDNGLELNPVIIAAGGPAFTSSLVGGSTNFSMLPVVGALSAVDQGECLSFLTVNRGNFFSLVSLPDTELTNEGEDFPDNVKGLKGKTVGLYLVGSTESAVLATLLEAAGMTPSDVVEVAVGAPDTAVAALQAGQVDVIVATPPTYIRLGENGYKTVVSVDSPDMPTRGIPETFFGTTCEYADEHPEVIEAFCRSQQETRNWALDPKNEDSVLEAIEKADSFTAEEAATAWEQSGSNSWFPDVGISEEVWATTSVWGIDPPEYSKYVNADCQKAVAEVAGS
ncbi:MAG: ABC transporter substrate-binding protein [Mycetocola sp.]